jgi:hypothetical protein
MRTGSIFLVIMGLDLLTPTGGLDQNKGPQKMMDSGDGLAMLCSMGRYPKACVCDLGLGHKTKFRITKLKIRPSYSRNTVFTPLCKNNDI